MFDRKKREANHKRSKTDETAAEGPAEPPTLTDFMALAKLLYERRATEAQRERFAELRAELRESSPNAQVAILHRRVLLGALLAQDGHVEVSVGSASITFDWAAAHRLLFEIDSIHRNATTWLGASEEARSYHERAYGLVTHVFGCIDSENKASAALGPEAAAQPTADPANTPEGSDLDQGQPQADLHQTRRAPSPQFVSEIELLDHEVEVFREEVETSGVRSARSVYAIGMAWGTLAVAVASALGGWAFVHWDVQALNGVAFVSGSLGAVVSVLRRMGSDELEIDINARRGTLLTLGAVRPAVGAVFGLVVFCTLAAGLIPIVNIPEDASEQLAFYAAIGFLAGFNERFAQDLLAGAARRFTSIEQEESPR